MSEPSGVSVDLARELGRRLGVPVELVTFDAAGKVFDALKTGAWDVAFLAIDPARAADIAFTAPYVVIEGTYLVPADSPLRTIGDVDREGVRVGPSAGAATSGRRRDELRAVPQARPRGPHGPGGRGGGHGCGVGAASRAAAGGGN